MEIFLYIAIPTLTFFGLTSMPTRWISMMMLTRSPDFVNFFPIFGAIIIWNLIDMLYILSTGAPIPIAIFFICWIVKLVEGNLVKKADWQTNINMAEAWVLFISGLGFNQKYNPYY
jgi:predicted PurR-regulated permease PerM